MAKESKLKGLVYVGAGDTAPGIPARNIPQDEWEALEGSEPAGMAIAVANELYKPGSWDAPTPEAESNPAGSLPPENPVEPGGQEGAK